ncbi:MAG TPA: hypothetical protein VLT17_14100 [Gemmatimonadales bacterium]|jgi:probable HAF family extracellular repeat protein|nr:hypothetical protein [Gemmatimonadales bacterium]
MRANYAALMAACGLLAACPAVPVQETQGITELPIFAIQELGLLAGGSVSQAMAINGSGQAVGYAIDAGAVRHAVYFQGGAAVQLPEPANTTRSDAYGINDDGVIVGSVRISGVELPARWDTPASQPVLLTLPAGATTGRARSINSDGLIVGFATGDELPVIWQTDGSGDYVDATIADSHEPSQINDEGDFVGNAEDIEAGFVWSEDDGFVFVGSLSGEEDDQESEARGLNNNGVVVGNSDNADGQTRAFRWTEARNMVELGAPPGGDDGVVATAINDDNLVAGFGFTGTVDAITTSQPAVTIATETSQAFSPLATLGGDRAEPSNGASINRCGVIVGFAFPTGSTNRRAVAWVPTGCSVQ